MLIYDGYYVLFVTSILVLCLSLVHSTRILKHVPDKLVLLTMTAIVCVSAYNYHVGNYFENYRIENGGYFLMAVVITMFFLNLVTSSGLSLIGVGGLLILICAGVVGGSDYGSDWLYDSMNMKMSQNSFLIVLFVSLCITALVFYYIQLTPTFQWILSVCLISISDALCFSILVGRCVGWYQNTGDTYEVLEFVYFPLYLSLGLMWYIVPSYLTLPREKEETKSRDERKSLISKA